MVPAPGFCGGLPSPSETPAPAPTPAPGRCTPAPPVRSSRTKNLSRSAGTPTVNLTRKMPNGSKGPDSSDSASPPPRSSARSARSSGAACTASITPRSSPTRSLSANCRPVASGLSANRSPSLRTTARPTARSPCSPLSACRISRSPPVRKKPSNSMSTRGRAPTACSPSSPAASTTPCSTGGSDSSASRCSGCSHGSRNS